MLLFGCSVAHGTVSWKTCTFLITSVGLKCNSPGMISLGSIETEKTPGFMRVNV